MNLIHICKIRFQISVSKISVCRTPQRLCSLLRYRFSIHFHQNFHEAIQLSRLMCQIIGMGGETTAPFLEQKNLLSPIFEKLRVTTPDAFSVNEFRFLEEKKFRIFPTVLDRPHSAGVAEAFLFGKSAARRVGVGRGPLCSVNWRSHKTHQYPRLCSRSE